MKKILIISTSLRHNSNSDLLAQEFAKGAQSAKHQVERISLVDKNLNFCRGCLVCQTKHLCVIKDDAIEIAEKAAAADVIVFATPVYYYEMSGQMKTLLDRMNSLYDTDYRFRDIYLLATAAEADDSAMEGTINGLQGWISCFPKTKLKGVIRGTGVDIPNAISGNPAMKSAYEMGAGV